MSKEREKSRLSGRSRRRLAKETPNPSLGLGRESASVLLVVLAVFLAVSLYSYAMQEVVDSGFARAEGPRSNLMGLLGHAVAQVLFSLLGWCSFVTVLWALLLARTVWSGGWPLGSRTFLSLLGSLAGSLLMLASCAAMACVIAGYQGGGLLGARVSSVLVRYVNGSGTVLIGFAFFILSLGLATGFGASRLAQALLLLVSFVRRLGLGVLSGFRHGFSAVLGRDSVMGKVLLFGVLCSAAWTGRTAYRFATFPIRVLGRAWNRRREEKKLETSERVTPLWVKTLERPVSAETTKEKKGSPAVRNSLARHKGVKPKIHRRRRFGSAKRKREAGVLSEEDSSSVPKSAKRKGRRSEPLLPPLDLLVSGEHAGKIGPKDEELVENCRRLEQAFEDFRIGGCISDVRPGPVVTLYEFEPAAGVKVQRVIALADDLALALRVDSVRVFAPVPGKGTVGIEVPNAQRDIVRLRDLLEHPDFENAQMGLPLALGKDIFGETYIADLARMPHLLIAGATGTGKSVCINSILLSLLFRYGPDELRLLLIDPKMLELSVYEGVTHLLAPVVTQTRWARGVFWWAVEEMERRYRLMKELGVRNVSSYNREVAALRMKSGVLPLRRRASRVIELEEKDVVATANPYEGLDREQGMEDHGSLHLLGEPPESMPRIVIVVDELADLMLRVGREIEELLTRLAQKARAAGIHLILATQRPSVDVITGLIKANFPSRISFKVASRIDGRTVLDVSGAEKLLGLGDMLYLSPGSNVRRLHGPFVSDREVIDVVEWLRVRGAPDYDPRIERVIQACQQEEKEGGASQDDEYDPLYDEAVSLVIEKGQASTSMVQRQFRIGYNRAARILETMEREGVVGPAEGARPRQILIGTE